MLVFFSLNQKSLIVLFIFQTSNIFPATGTFDMHPAGKSLLRVLF